MSENIIQGGPIQRVDQSPRLRAAKAPLRRRLRMYSFGFEHGTGIALAVARAIAPPRPVLARPAIKHAGRADHASETFGIARAIASAGSVRPAITHIHSGRTLLLSEGGTYRDRSHRNNQKSKSSAHWITRYRPGPCRSRLQTLVPRGTLLKRGASSQRSRREVFRVDRIAIGRVLRSSRNTSGSLIRLRDGSASVDY